MTKLDTLMPTSVSPGEAKEPAAPAQRHKHEQRTALSLRLWRAVRRHAHAIFGAVLVMAGITAIVLASRAWIVALWVFLDGSYTVAVALLSVGSLAVLLGVARPLFRRGARSRHVSRAATLRRSLG